MNTIYILKLEDNKYYVGKTKNINKRFLDHFTNNGSEWTKKYKPIEIINKHNSNDNFDEEKYTLLTMDEYGIDNVRGGSYCKLELSNEDKTKAQQTINSMLDKCYKCGIKGHYAKECEKIYLLNNPDKLEEFIRIKLGQNIFPTPKWEEHQKLCNACENKNLTNGDSSDSDNNEICKNKKCYNFYNNYWKKVGHLRFDFDARDCSMDINNNKKIIELFNDFYKDKRCIIHSHKGGILIQIVSFENFQNYDYYYTNTEERYCNYTNDNFPYIAILSYGGAGTIDIIKDLIIQINIGNYKINNNCYNVEIKNNEISPQYKYNFQLKIKK